MTITVSERRVKDLIKRNRYLKIPGLRRLAKARDLAVAVAIRDLGIERAIAYYPSILAGKRACAQQGDLTSMSGGRWVETANFHVSSDLTAGECAAAIRMFEDAAKPAVMFNARCLTEGVDIGTRKDRPVDAMAFASPRRSVVDIVQAAGRAMRRGGDKEVGYVLISIVVAEQDVRRGTPAAPEKPSGISFTEGQDPARQREALRILRPARIAKNRSMVRTELRPALSRVFS